MGSASKSPATRQLMFMDDSAKQALEPDVKGSGGGKKSTESNGMIAACHAGAPPIVAYRMIGGERYPYTAAQGKRALEYGRKRSDFVFVKGGQR